MSILLSIDNIARPEIISVHVLALLLISFATISIALMLKPGIFRLIVSSYVQLEQKTFTRESIPLSETPGILLFVNYLLTMILLFQFGLSNEKSDFNILFLFPIIWYGWTFLSVLIFSWLSGEFKSTRDYYTISLLSFEFIGILLWVFILIFALYPEYQNVTWYTMLFIVILDFVWRYFKILINLHLQGLTWYYLILYFCTLEIMPLFVLTYVFTGNFIEK